MTPEAARAAAQWMDKLEKSTATPTEFRVEADRLENTAKTPGRVLVDAYGECWDDCNSDDKRRYEEQAAAVIAHVVGPDRVVVDRQDAQWAVDNLLHPGPRATTVANRIHEALS